MLVHESSFVIGWDLKLGFGAAGVRSVFAACNGNLASEIHKYFFGFQDRVLSLLWWKTEKMLMDLDDYEERRAAKRWDDRD